MPNEGEKKSALLHKIDLLKPQLTQSGKIVATYIQEHPEQVIEMSVATLAEMTGVSEPTVIRTCRSFGYNGYQSFKIALAQDIVSPMQLVNEALSADDDMKGIMYKVLSGAISALTATHDTINFEDVEAVAKAIMKANNVHIYGVGSSASIAQDCYHKLSRVGVRAAAYTDANFQAMSAAYAKKGDIVFAISHSGSSKAVVDNVRLAKENGALIFTLTSVGSSPLTKFADISLYTVSDETKYRIVSMASRIAALSIIDSIYVYIAAQIDDIKNLKVEKALENLKY